MRIGVIGCRFNTDRFIRQLIRDKFNINLVITRKIQNTSGEYSNIEMLCKENGIECLVSETYDLSDDFIENILKYNLDVIFCVGWQRLLSELLLKNIKYNIWYAR